MRTLFVAILLCLCHHSSASAQSPWAQKIFFGVDKHDFGTCPYGAQLKHRFRMKNIYAVPLEITNIRSSCGCLTYKASKKRLEPQEEGYIDINMDGSRFKGHKVISLYVTVGPKFVSTATFVVTANARTDVVFNPGQVNFGVVSAGSAITQTIDVEYAGDLDWKILEVHKSRNAPFDVVPREMYRQSKRLFRSGKVGYQMAVTLKPDAPPGPFREEILLKTNDPASPVLTVVAEGNIQASLTASPQKVKLGVLKVGQEKSQKVILRGNQPFRVVSVQGAGNGFSVDVPTATKNFHILNIRYQPPAPGTIQRNLLIQTTMGKGESVSVTVQATVTP